MSTDLVTIQTSPTTAALPTRPECDSAFDSRARTLLKFIAALPRPAEDTQRRLSLHSIARLSIGCDVERAFHDIVEINRDPGNSWMFLWHSTSDAWCRFSRMYPPELHKLVKQQMISHDYRVRDGHTENHRLMIATAGYLTAQSFPEWDKSAEVLARSELHIKGFLDRMRRFGQGEFSASTYGVLYLNTLGSLAELALDPRMRDLAVQMLDRLLAAMAGLWLDARLTGGHSRDAHPAFGKESPGAAEVALWLFFGGGQFNPHANEPHYSVINAIGTYRPLHLISKMASDRRNAYEQLESHDLTDPCAATHDRNETRSVPQGGHLLKGNGYISRVGVRKYTYVTPSYALGCFYDGRQEDVIWTGQARRWSLDFVTPGPRGKCFFTHPIRDGEMTGGTYWRNWIGSSPYEQVLQHRSTLIALYNIPRQQAYKAVPREPVQSDEFPFVDGYFGGLQVIQDHPSGWIFAHGGSVLIAARTVCPGAWINVDDTLDHTALGRCYRSHGHRNAVIIETSPSQSPAGASETLLRSELTQFADTVLNCGRIDASGVDCDHPTLAYTDTHGHTLQLQFDGQRQVDGVALDFSQWPLLRNPWVEAEVGSGKLRWLQCSRNLG